MLPNSCQRSLPNDAFLRLFRDFRLKFLARLGEEIPPCSSVTYPARPLRGDVAERSKALPC